MQRKKFPGLSTDEVFTEVRKVMARAWNRHEKMVKLDSDEYDAHLIKLTPMVTSEMDQIAKRCIGRSEISAFKWCSGIVFEIFKDVGKHSMYDILETDKDRKVNWFNTIVTIRRDIWYWDRVGKKILAARYKELVNEDKHDKETIEEWFESCKTKGEIQPFDEWIEWWNTSPYGRAQGR
ncbi:MAG: hypothetical protein [Cressdnaviricota sp.]|nr:MAG: hypothetical protein [Cressdnaviricota sp.]